MKWTVRRVRVFQAWDGRTVRRWYVCRGGVPCFGRETFAECLRFVRDMEGGGAWDVVSGRTWK